MRIRIASFGVVAAVASMVACNDNAFLTEVPRNFVGPSNFYRNAGDAIAAINAVYAGFINGTGDDYYGRNFPMLVEYPTETVSSGRLGGTNERSLPDNFSHRPNHAYIESVWRSAYNAINRANAVLDNVPGIPMDDALKARILGEARFLRALHYFNLVRLFGGVPIREVETKNLDELEVERATPAEVYALIVNDLKAAQTALPPKSAYTASDIGRATSGAATTLLGKVYLQRGGTGVGQPIDFDSAEVQLRSVVNAAAPNNYALVGNVMTLWDFYGGTVVENNAEVIFDIQNTRAPGLGGRMSSHMAANLTAPLLGAATNGSVAAELNFYQSYATNDARRPATWLLSWNGATATNAWAPPPALVGSAANTAYGSHTPFPRKYLDRLMTATGAEEPNYILLRYADVLLMLAEAINERAGPTAEAVGFLNAVRTRAQIPLVPLSVTQAQLKDSIFMERRWELVLEGHGHFDSQRHWNWAKARIEANLVLGRIAFNATTSPNTGGNRYPRANNDGPCTGTGAASVCTLTDKYKFYPVPQRAIDLNPRLTQNPGW